MSFYQDRYAEVYDLIYQNKPYDREAKCIVDLFRKHGQPAGGLIDVACGTGSHAFQFEKQGYAVTGVDISRDLLAQATSKAEKRKSSVRFLAQDMRELDVKGQSFEVATCLFDAIGYALTNDGIVSTLSGIERHLVPGGLVAIEFWHAAAMLKHAEAHRVLTLPTPSGKLVRTAKSSVDIVKQICAVDYELVGLNADGSYWNHTEKQANRFFLVQEMSALVTAARLTPIEFVNAYDVDSPINESTFHVLVLARK